MNEPTFTLTHGTIAEVKNFLAICAKTAAQIGHRPVNGYLSIDQFVLENGFGMPGICPRAEWPEELREGRRGFCFYNAAMAALENPLLTYCEGHAMGVMPVHHAWVIDQQGRVIDNTWDEGKAYYGIAVKTEFLRERLCAQETYGLIDQPRFKWPMFEISPAVWEHPIAARMKKDAR